MAIQTGDIKLIASQVMLDVSEGGGSPTPTVIADGVSNAIFPDISELDRAGGRVNLRKIFASVQTADVDTYLGANVIVAEPPADPKVSVTLFTTGDQFDRRDAAKGRMESYLAMGPAYFGFLFGNHISGQRTLSIWQKQTDLPPIGSSMVLRKRDGFGDQADQFVRVTSSSSQSRVFEDEKGPFTRVIVTLGLSDALRYDFPGFDVSRYDPTVTQLAEKTRISDTIVADAARYYGVVPLETAASIGAFSAKGTSMYTQLVPNAQVETPIADARTNQLSTGLVKTGSAVTQSLTLAFTTTQNLFVGGSILPGTLSLVKGAITLTDAGGKLYDTAAAEVGFIDYENGVLSLATNVFGTGSGTYQVTYTPAAVPQVVSQSMGRPVTIGNRSQSYVVTIEPVPAKSSLAVHYRAAGRWYVLRENGAGAIRGAETGYGAGTLNYTTGTVSVTLGALPDVGSSIIYQWAEEVATQQASALLLDNDAKFYWPINSDGLVTTVKGAKAFTPGGITITWNDGTARTATDNSAGELTGAATGKVIYSQGVIKFSPNLLPPKGTVIHIVSQASARVSTSITTDDAGSTHTGNLGATNITPGTVSLRIPYGTISQPTATLTDAGNAELYTTVGTALVTDNSSGVLQANIFDHKIDVGTINYATGAIILNEATNFSAVPWSQVVGDVSKPIYEWGPANYGSA